MYQMKVSSSIFSIIASIVGVLQCSGVDWAEFRGPNGNPVHDGTLPSNGTRAALRMSLGKHRYLDVEFRVRL